MIYEQRRFRRSYIISLICRQLCRLERKNIKNKMSATRHCDCARSVVDAINKPSHCLDCACASDLSRDKTLFNYSTRLRPKYGRCLSRFQFLRPSFRTTFAHWFSLIIIQSFTWCSRQNKTCFRPVKKRAKSMLFPPLYMNGLDFIPNFIKSEKLDCKLAYI